jgi:hypothetical protein
MQDIQLYKRSMHNNSILCLFILQVQHESNIMKRHPSSHKSSVSRWIVEKLLSRNDFRTNLAKPNFYRLILASVGILKLSNKKITTNTKARYSYAILSSGIVNGTNTMNIGIGVGL